MSTVPVLDYSLTLSPSTKPIFIAQLQNALINVGFLYLSNHTVPSTTVATLESYIPRVFALPQEAKNAISMVNSPHFLGYTALGKETTRGATDQREQFDFGTEGYKMRWRPGQPDYLRIWGPSQVSKIQVKTRDDGVTACNIITWNTKC